MLGGCNGSGEGGASGGVVLELGGGAGAGDGDDCGGV